MRKRRKAVVLALIGVYGGGRRQVVGEPEGSRDRTVVSIDYYFYL